MASPVLPLGALKALTHASFVALCVYVWWAGQEASEPAISAPAGGWGFHMSECAKARGIDFRHENVALDRKLDNIAVQIAALGASVSVVDANGDGWADIYATTSAFEKPNALYINQHDGTFRDVAASAGLADLNRAGEGASMGTIWADYDNDGKIDCFLYRYGYLALYHNEGNLHFKDVTEEAGLRRWMNSNSATWIDYDRDGLLDLYVAGYFREDIDFWHLKTTKIMQDSFEFSNNGGHNYLFHNLGHGRFEDVTEKLGVDSTRWTLAVVAADLNGDGWQDLYLANDYGPEELFLNRKGEHFERASGVGLEESSKSGMSVALGDIQNDGRLAVYVTNISKQGYLFQGNNLRLNRLAENGVLTNIADGALLDCGWSWGSQFGDLNNDGRVDLVVLNGFVSANKERDYWYAMTKLASGTSALAEDAANWPEQGDKSLSGYEHSHVLVNLSPLDGPRRVRFVDAAAEVGVDDLYDGRGVAFGDFSHKGVIDMVVANQAAPLLFYANTVDPKNHWVEVELSGTRSNRLAIGAQVTVHFAGHKSTQAVLAGSGFASQNELALHFGLGATTEIEKFVVRWPSGVDQVIDHPAINRRHALVEPLP